MFHSKTSYWKILKNQRNNGLQTTNFQKCTGLRAHLPICPNNNNDIFRRFKSIGNLYSLLGTFKKEEKSARSLRSNIETTYFYAY